MELKIATLNLCLGLANKKDTIKRLILENSIDILCVQEVELKKNYQKYILSFRNYRLEVDTNTKKSRTGIYISNNVDYMRRTDLEIRPWWLSGIMDNKFE